MELEKVRALAGLPMLVESKKKNVDGPAPEDLPPVEDAAAITKPAKQKSPEEELQEMIEKMAKKAEGKDVETLVTILRKVYDLGVKDGIAQATEKE